METVGTINLESGDPRVFESYWKGEDADVTIRGFELVSYFSDAGNICWYMEPEFGEAVRRVHAAVGNAVTEKRHLVAGTGSSQLYQAALYALSSNFPDDALPLSVVSAAPYYSSYPAITEMLKSGLYKWAGDKNSFLKQKKDDAHIEVVCSPNNPDGTIPKSIADGNSEGDENKLMIHDLAYYWPQYTPITSAADHDIMLFTLSKCTGHAGSRLGWAIVKDEAVARKMIKFVELSTIGTSKEAQLRAARTLNHICDDYHNHQSSENQGFFEFGHRVMADRWHKLREAVTRCGTTFLLPSYPVNFCNFKGKLTTSYPAFAWMECKEGEDAASLIRERKILARSGERFGVDKKLVRISMVDSDEIFNLFLQRLATI